MSKTLALQNSPAENTTTVYENLGVMKVLRTQLENRLKRMRRQFRELRDIYEAEIASDFFMDEWREIGSNAAGACSDLEDYIANLDEEINKVTKGILIMETLKDEAGREALSCYIEADTEISIVNLLRTRDNYASVVRSLHAIKRSALNEESE